MIEVRRLYVTETVSSPLPVYFIAFLAHGNLHSYKQTEYIAQRQIGDMQSNTNLVQRRVTE